MKKFLIIQTASIGDVILATPVIEKIAAIFPGSQIDFILKKGTARLFNNHPHITNLYVWHKDKNKYRNLLKIIREVRNEKYTHVINLHRFASSGIIVFFSGAKIKIGFDKNPFSFCYTFKIKHEIGNNTHESERNLKLIEAFTNKEKYPVRLYPSTFELEKINKFIACKYICIAPASLWFTKQFPEKKWVEFIDRVDEKYQIFLLGADSDIPLCESIKEKSINKNITVLSGKLTMLESAALMESAVMNFVNDSSPLHLASSVNAPVTAIFCSTVTSFGFGPLSDDSVVIECEDKLPCRPCGLHGHKDCPERHFSCAENISVDLLLKRIK